MNQIEKLRWLYTPDPTLLVRFTTPNMYQVISFPWPFLSLNHQSFILVYYYALTFVHPVIVRSLFILSSRYSKDAPRLRWSPPLSSLYLSRSRKNKVQIIFSGMKGSYESLKTRQENLQPESKSYYTVVKYQHSLGFTFSVSIVPHNRII